MDHDEEDANTPEHDDCETSANTPEQCFYASFKIYLSDSRKNSVCGLDDTGIDCFSRKEG